MTDLIEHAKALALAGDFSPDDLGGDIGTMSLRNPDGPELLSIVQSLSERIAVLEGNWEALERIIGEVYVETDGPDRVRWEGVWYDGPLATAYLRTMKVIQKLARASLIKGGSRA